MKPSRQIKGRHVLLAWVLVYFPWLPGFPLNKWVPDVPYAYVIDANLAAQYALIAFSLVLLTGWVGQISLGQGSFVGIGAFTTGLLVRTLGIPFPLNLPLVAVITAGVASILGVVALRVRGLYLAVATLIFAWMADAYLFGQAWLVGSGGGASIPNRPIGLENSATRFDLSNKRVFYLIMLAAVAAVWYALVNLRDSKTGRAFFAIRGSEMAAVSLGIDVTRYKLLAFALSGGLAGIAGNLMMTDVRAASPVVFQFTVSLFYLGIAVVGGIASLGGSLSAGILFAALTEVFFRVELLQGWLDVVTVGLLLVVLLGFPGGMGAMGPALLDRVRRLPAVWARIVARRRSRRARIEAERAAALSPLDADEVEEWEVVEPLEALAPALAEDVDALAEAVAEAPEPSEDEEQAAVADEASSRKGRRLSLRLPLPRKIKVVRRSINLQGAALPDELTVEELTALAPPPPPSLDWRTLQLKDYPLPPDRADRAPILEAEHVIVQFGGLRAVSDVSLAVREHEITALIGPNGAGKTTTFNAIAGLNEPTSGTIKLFGEDVTSYPVHIRAQMGVGRTFQLIQLFPQLTVFDNLLVATHVHNETGVWGHIALTGRAITAEAEARRQVRTVVELLGLEDVVDRRVAGLPFGILRQVEIARALVTEAPLLMLDEPASGLDNAETDELAQLLYYVRAQLGVTILLIEHDMRMVTSCSDYIYVINRGTPLAEGTPAEIQSNPEVIAAYLGQAEEDTDTKELAPA